MKHTIFNMLLFLCTAMPIGIFVSCSDEIPQPTPTLEGNTVIIYMGAENSLSSFSNSDLFEITEATERIPENCQVVVFRDSEFKPSIYHFTKNGRTTWKDYDAEVNSADANTFESILREIIQNFPSRKYSLVLWSHGTGWIDQSRSMQRSIIIDNNKNSFSNNGTWLHTYELAATLAKLPKMEFIMFDACFMQSAEVACELYPYCKYIIGSPAEIPSEGAPYHLILNALCRADIQGIIENYALGYSKDEGVALSAVCSENFPSFCEETAKHIPFIFSKSSMPSTQGIQIYSPASYANKMPIAYDIRSAMHKLLDEVAYATWDKEWQKAILYPYCANRWASQYSGTDHHTLTDPMHYGGISFNIPDEQHQLYGWDTMFSHTQWYWKTGWSATGW